MNVLTRRNMSLFIRFRDASSEDERTRLLADLCHAESDGLHVFFWQHRNHSLRAILRDLRVHPAAVGQVARVICDTPRTGIVDNDSESLIGVSVNEIEARIRNGFLLTESTPEADAPAPEAITEPDGPTLESLPDWIRELPADALASVAFRRTLFTWCQVHDYCPFEYRLREAHVKAVADVLGIKSSSVRWNLTKMRNMTARDTPTDFPPISPKLSAAALEQELQGVQKQLRIYEKERKLIAHTALLHGQIDGPLPDRVRRALEAVRCPRNCACGRDGVGDANEG